MATRQRYPLSTASGQAIPLDVIKVLGLIRLPFTAAAFNSQTLNAAYQDKLFAAYATEDCYIDTRAVPVLLVDNVTETDLIFIPAGVMVVFISNSLYLTARGVLTSGTLHVQIIDTWAGLVQETQLTRG